MKRELITLPAERIENIIYLIRGEKVMLDRDLAELYEVQTKALNQAIRRNRERFPSDFMFQLTKVEVLARRGIVAQAIPPTAVGGLFRPNLHHRGST